MKRIITTVLLLVFTLSSVILCDLILLPSDPLLDESRYTQKPSLSENEITELRKIYPKKVYEDDPAINIVNSDNRDRKRITAAETYIYCEVTKEPVMDMKNFSDYSNYYMAVRVIKDTENLFVPNKEIVVVTSLESKTVLDIKEGNKYLLPLTIYPELYEDEGKFDISFVGYFVTDDGYCFSAFSEYDCRYTGLNLPQVMKNLKKTDEEFDFYLSAQETRFKKHEMKNYEDFKNIIRYKYTKMNENRLNEVIKYREELKNK
ncbi:MAG: hypothetical protein E7564_00890 [Ruminococcaceae bacterium]|nr:hypothetical protein [Oscillospiraceae bacterium]